MNASEKSRINSKKIQILQALRNAGIAGITNVELSRIALRYGGHLGKLYEQGYKIDKVSLGNGVYNYILISEPEVLLERESALSKLLKEVEWYGIDSDLLSRILDKNNIGVKYKANTYK